MMHMLQLQWVQAMGTAVPVHVHGPAASCDKVAHTAGTGTAADAL